VREHLHDEELELCQLLPPDYPSLVHPDETVRAAAVEALGRMLDAAVVLGAGSLYVRPGSLNDAGPWTPHPENHLPATRDRLVESLRRLAPRAEDVGVPLALEAHVVSPLYTPVVVREVIDHVDSTMLRFNMDPVNLIRTLDQAYDSTPLVDELFDLLGDVTVAAHAKDVTVTPRLVLHIDECVPGQGHLDHELFLRRFSDCCPRGVVLIEHLSRERVPEARWALLEFAARVGLRFEDA
jgi:sugar phosphate isomerase/epimerase